MEGIMTLSESLMALLPGFGVAIGASSVWWVLCRYVFMRKEPIAWLERISDKSDSFDAIDDQLAVLSRQLTVAKSGSPADRLFFSGLLLMGLLAVGFLLLR